MLVSLSTRRHIKAAVWLREGTSDRVSLDVKDVVAAAIKGGTDAVVLCHNHPNGVALPSMEDMEATGSIARALGLVNIHLLDHFILTDTECFPCGMPGGCPSTTSRPAHFSGPECRIPVYIIKLLCYNHIERYNQLWFFARGEPERRAAVADEKFELVSSYQPTGDQPQAIETLVEGVQRGDRCQTLLGVTGSGKTFTMANVIARCNRPTLVLAHNKTLAAQLCTGSARFSPTMRWSILSATTTTTSRKPTSPAPIPILKRTAPSTTRSTVCATRLRRHFRNGGM